MNTKKSQVLWVNHASLLIKKQNTFILTDPWHQQPAFSNLLASSPMSMHPAYIAALKSKLTILISHNHEDHYDIELLKIFDKSTLIILADLKCYHLYKTIKNLGFNNIKKLPDKTTCNVDDIKITALINQNEVHEDAIFTIDLQDGLVIHANDHWYKWRSDHIKTVSAMVSKYSAHQTSLWGQAHSATGYPLNAINLSSIEKAEIVKKTAREMLRCELRTAKALGIKQYVSYAGFISPYVPNKASYRDLVLFPTKTSMLKLAQEDQELTELLTTINILDIYPQDILHTESGFIQKSFISNLDYQDADLKWATAKYYKNYNIEPKHEAKKYTVNENKINKFCLEINTFMEIKGLNQNFGFTINCEDKNYHINKRQAEDLVLIVPYSFLEMVIDRRMSFEDLYTGFLGEWKFKRPKENYDHIINNLLIFAEEYMNN